MRTEKKNPHYEFNYIEKFQCKFPSLAFVSALSRRSKIITVLLLLAMLATPVSFWAVKRQQNRVFFEKHFPIVGKDFHRYPNDSSLMWGKALLLAQSGEYAKAIPYFEGMVEGNVYFKEHCMWFLSGCYIATGTNKEKALSLLVRLSVSKGGFSSPSIEIIEEIERKK